MKAEEDRKAQIVSNTIRRFSVASTIKDVELIYSQCEYKDPTVELVYTRRKSEVAEILRLAEVKREQDAEAIRLEEIRKTQDAETIRLAEEAQKIKNQARELEQEKVQIESQKLENNAIRNIENQIVIAPPKTKGTRTMWKMEIVDTTLVPREYCDPNEVRIREAIKNGAREIAGVRIYEDIVVG